MFRPKENLQKTKKTTQPRHHEPTDNNEDNQKLENHRKELDHRTLNLPGTKRMNQKAMTPPGTEHRQPMVTSPAGSRGSRRTTSQRRRGHDGRSTWQKRATRDRRHGQREGEYSSHQPNWDLPTASGSEPEQ